MKNNIYDILKFEDIIYIIQIISISLFIVSFVFVPFTIMISFNFLYIAVIIHGFLLYISWKLEGLLYEINKIKICLRKLDNNLNHISSK